MSHSPGFLARAKRCQMRAMRAALRTEMIELARTQRRLARKQRQRHLDKEQRALKSLIAVFAELKMGTVPFSSGSTGPGRARV